MTYSLVITERAEQLLDDCVSYLISVLENSSAALHLLDGISHIYDRLEKNPFHFATKMNR